MFLFLFLNIFLHVFFGYLIFSYIGTYSFFFFTQLSFSYIFFNFISFLIIFFLILSFFSNNPINTLLLILISFILSSFLLFQNSIEFLTYTFLIVYIGALMMLFLFVIMLFNLQQKQYTLKKKENFLGIFFIIIVAMAFYTNFFDNIFYALAIKNKIIFTNQTWYSTIFFFINGTLDSIRALETLYTKNDILFLFLTIILLFTLLSAINLALLAKQRL